MTTIKQPRLTLRRDGDRGHFDHGWLDTRHTFSFASYYDPAHMGFRALRVINEDRVIPSEGFPTHPHRDMEILTYVLDGALEHRDSLGNGGVIKPGIVQRMSAGTGIRHSEFNASSDAQVHFMQIWLMPGETGVKPSYDERQLRAAKGGLATIASRDGEDGSISIHQDARLRAGLLAPGDVVEHVVKPGRHAWIQLARGAIETSGVRLVAGDGASTSEGGTLRFEAKEHSEILVFDLA